MHIRCVISFLLFLAFIPLLVWAQKPPASFSHLTIEDGLPSNMLTDLHRDKNGFLWIASSKGLARYDGYVIKKFTHSETDSNSISGTYVHRVASDSKGNIWSTNNIAIDKYDVRTNKFTHYFLNKRDGFVGEPGKLFIDSRDSIWIGNGDGTGILNPLTGKVRKFIHNPSDSNSIPARGLMAICEDAEGAIWLSHYEEGLTRYDPKTNRFHTIKHNPNNPNSLPNSAIFDLSSDKKGNIYFTYYYEGAIGRYNIYSKTFKIFRNPEFFHNMRLVPNADGTIWIASIENGLLRFDSETGQVINYPHNNSDPESISESRANCLLIDADLNLWVGTLNKGLNKMDLRNDKVRYFDLTELSGKKQKINGMRSFEGENIWVASDKGLYRLHSKTSHLNRVNIPTKLNEVDYVSDGPKGTVWAQASGRLFEVDASTLAVREINSPYIRLPVHAAYEDSRSNLWVFADTTLMYFQGKNLYLEPRRVLHLKRPEPYLFNNYIERGSYLYISLDYFVYRVHLDNINDTVQFTYDNPKLRYTRKTSIAFINNRLILPHTDGGFFYQKDDKPILYDFRVPFLEDGQPAPWGFVHKDNEGVSFSTFQGVYNYKFKSKTYTNPSFFNIERIDPDQFQMLDNGNMIIAAGDGILMYHPSDFETHSKSAFETVLTDFYLSNHSADYGHSESPLSQSILTTSEMVLPYNKSAVSFEMTSLNFDDPKHNQYAYKLDGYDADWNYIGNRKVATYTNIPPGEYYFKYISGNRNGDWTRTKQVKIIVTPPFWGTWWFRILTVTIVFGSVFGFFKYRTRRIRMRNQELENQVRIRTAEIVSQNEEILAQKEEIERQESQIHELYTDLTDSIQTAQRIQESILPGEQILQKCFTDAFALYLPKDIVSGDFYWATQQGSKTYIAAVDCTGHGVAGAFISLIGYNLLTRVMREESEPTPAQILTKLNRYVIEVLQQEHENAISKEGMEISMCMVDANSHQVTFAGANNKLYIARSGIIEIINGDANHVGIMPMGKTAKFNDKVIDVVSGDVYYLFSDGYAGQFGGNNGQDKLKYPKFREYLTQIHTLPLNEQKQQLYKMLNDWKKGVPQTDDIMVLAFKL